MDASKYISSGQLELYVLGSLDPAAMREVEDMVVRYPEVREELDRIELALEGFAQTDAPQVDAGVLDRVLNDIQQLEPPPGTNPQKAAPQTPAQKISRGPLSVWLPWALIIAILGALWLNYSELVDQRQANNELQLRYEQLEKECGISQQALRNAQQYIGTLTNAATENVALAAADETSDKSAAVFYNPATQQTLFLATNLPAPPTGKQYQLWAIDAEGPKNLGVLATDLDGETILEVDYIDGVAKFAVTLEDTGGKPAPDLTQLQVIGDVAG